MNEPHIGGTLRDPRSRQLLIILGVALLALFAIAAIWQTTGTRGAKHDLASANDRVVAKQREVDDARRQLDQRIAELRALRADADVQATKLGSAVDQQVNGVVTDAGTGVTSTAAGEIDLRDPATEYYVRDRRGRFIRVTRP
jgi:type II secretory pathway component PulM